MDSIMLKIQNTNIQSNFIQIKTKQRTLNIDME